MFEDRRNYFQSVTDPLPSPRRSAAWPIDSSYPHRLKYTMCFTLTSSPRIRRRKNMGRHTRGHPRSLCKVKKSTRWSQSYKHNVKRLVIRSNTRYIGRATLQQTTRGCPMRTYTHWISLRTSMPREGRSKQLKGEENDYEDSSSPSHVFPQQQLQQLLFPWSDHTLFPRRRNPVTDTENSGTHRQHRASRLNVRPRRRDQRQRRRTRETWTTSTHRDTGVPQ
jgi:hypothetical protein